MKKRIVILVAVVGALLLIAGPVAAEPPITPYTGVECPHTDWVIDPGELTFPDGNLHIRGRVSRWVDTVPGHPELTGITIVVVNANFRGNMAGPVWGTYTTGPEEGEVFWEGTWTGMVYPDGSTFVRAVGQGQGDFEGLKALLTIDFPPGECGAITGRILEPRSQ